MYVYVCKVCNANDTLLQPCFVLSDQVLVFLEITDAGPTCRLMQCSSTHGNTMAYTCFLSFIPKAVDLSTKSQEELIVLAYTTLTPVHPARPFCVAKTFP